MPVEQTSFHPRTAPLAISTHARLPDELNAAACSSCLAALISSAPTPNSQQEAICSNISESLARQEAVESVINLSPTRTYALTIKTLSMIVLVAASLSGLALVLGTLVRCYRSRRMQKRQAKLRAGQ